MPEPSAAPLVSLQDIRAAAQRLDGVILRTPLLRLTEHSFVKPESLQPTGAFKLRGAYNALAQLPPEALSRGVVTHSSGNHGQALAYAARMLGTRAVVVMPQGAPAIKVERVRAFGGQIVFVGESHEERSARAHELAEQEGLVLVPSADDARIIAGQGTVGLEIVEQLAAAGLPSDRLTVLVPIGQGGLAAGVSTAVKGLLPGARVVGVEPELAADTRDSLARRRIVRWATADVQRTMADGVRMEAPAPLPFAHLLRHLDEVLTVTEDEIGEAVARAAGELRLVLEPSGAISLAALYGGAGGAGTVTIAVLSGGNVDGGLYVELLRRYHRT
ncbi:MAG TPA: threonine/serine dehydratase [Candidatus Limnocylindria bacterium]|nr:threonine/serine dehydratase [Candidatus Limnocylindria bacterium]